MFARRIVATGCASLLLAAVMLASTAASTGADPAFQNVREKYAIVVIDDFGNNGRGTKEMMELPFHLTVAVMPFLPTTKRDAEQAYRVGHDVIVHLPMEPFSGRKTWLGPGVVSTDLSEEEIRKRVHAAIDDVPHAIGINNHMGSKATTDPRVMRIVLDVCKERGLFFLDSHTSYHSIVAKVANEMGVPSIENHLFLDNRRTKPFMRKQFETMRSHLNAHTPCIAIGHVGAGGVIMAEVLREQYEIMKKNDITFLKISDLLLYKDPTKHL
ncbi:hypothetical protein PAE9249_04494 [Paenibacillus sp. CECT 9249]|nr:divergent polysaccharide deacetylase family protein [Paenibacillus sp. MSJ-34]CAH0121958.1 hypothetical protein PAE9249_04494 [Paenibacillus sp. CECT 9249]